MTIREKMGQELDKRIEEARTAFPLPPKIPIPKKLEVESSPELKPPIPRGEIRRKVMGDLERLRRLPSTTAENARETTEKTITEITEMPSHFIEDLGRTPERAHKVLSPSKLRAEVRDRIGKMRVTDLTDLAIDIIDTILPG